MYKWYKWLNSSWWYEYISQRSTWNSIVSSSVNIKQAYPIPSDMQISCINRIQNVTLALSRFFLSFVSKTIVDCKYYISWILSRARICLHIELYELHLFIIIIDIFKYLQVPYEHRTHLNKERDQLRIQLTNCGLWAVWSRSIWIDINAYKNVFVQVRVTSGRIPLNVPFRSYLLNRFTHRWRIDNSLNQIC